MYRGTCFSRGLMTVLFACGSKPFAIWDIHCENGYVSKFIDDEIKSRVVEIGGVNVSTTYMVCPKGKSILGINLPFLVMIVKNLKKYFSFEVTILDDSGLRRRFRASNFQSTTQVNPLCTFMPIGLSDGWNQIQFNLAEFTRRAYKTRYMETQQLKINCNIRLRRVYFAERLLTDEELPAEYKLYFPLASNVGKLRKANEITEKQEVPEERKSSKSEIVRAPSVRSYRLSQDKMTTVSQEEAGQFVFAKGPRVSGRGIDEHHQEEAQQVAGEEENLAGAEEEIVIKVTDEETPEETTGEERVADIVEDECLV